MKSKILLTSALLGFGMATIAQNASRTFAITGNSANDFAWMNIRQVDLNSGVVTKTIFEKNKTAFTITNVETKQVLDKSAVLNGNIYAPSVYPTATFVAAAAYDKRSNRLYYIPMRMNELRWVDLNEKGETVKFYNMQSPLLFAEKGADESRNVTRMVIAADGNGYAITNDGNHLYQFTTGKKPVITDLGTLIDAESNKGISIHNKCTSWGGDMVADAFGKLYVITAGRNIFVVDIDTRIATFKGQINNLPANFTANGAAVNDNGDIVIISANVFTGYYTVNLKTLAATLVPGSDLMYNSSDLANSNLLFQKEADVAKQFGSATDIRTETLSGTKVAPNPVTGSSFKILFDGDYNGAFTVIISDIAGRNIQSTQISLAKGQQYQNINIRNKPVAGTYLVKVINDAGKTILTDKLIIQ
ncbi:MAG: T9SS type A sorting domain-containing protein [Chitinophagaceae bacterium]|nr:T9SS type A sorting domain-containing protein [Chitinophagaceae bacterium]